MNTQTHILMGALFFGRKMPRTAIAGALGGFTPDLSMLAIVAALKLSAVPNAVIFGEMYWQRWWQVTNAISHSFLLWGALLGVGLLMARRNAASWYSLLVAFSGSALLHAVVDFLCHREDAHMHFWPLSDWKFVSPVSYWDPSYHGDIFHLFETGLGLVMIVFLFRLYRNWLSRGLLALAAFFYVAVPMYFMLN